MTNPNTPRKWYETSYARIIVDNHIAEQDPQAMRNFDPAQYVAMMKKSGADASMVYACCHNGNSYYPTRVGHMHANLEGRDIFGETIDLLRREGMTPLAYHTVLFDNHAAKTHPQWRMEDAVGAQFGGRYWYCCANHPEYVDYAKRQLAEIVSYPVSGLYIDMTFWPIICACRSCRAKYMAESGRDIPERIDWREPEWVRFQRFRERSLDEFAAALTNSVRAQRPDISVVHQFSPSLVGWTFAQTSGIQKSSDWASGDFYGDKTYHRLGFKIMRAFANNIPIDFHTSRCVNLRDHTSTKEEEELVCSAATSLAGGGAYFFIDAINVDGTLHEPTYDRLANVSRRMLPYRERLSQLRPTLVADTGLYYSTYSCINDEMNGATLRSISGPGTHMNPPGQPLTRLEVHGTSIVLTHANIPYRVVVDTTTDYTGLKNLIVNNCMFLSEEEVARIRKFVADGGTLIATGLTSLYNLQGETTGNFALADVFGVSYTGQMSKSVNFLAADGWPDLVLANHAAPFVKATTAESLGKVMEPLCEPYHPANYTSIHSNPPGVATDYDGLTVNTFGKGRCIYLYSSLLSLQQAAQRAFGIDLLRKYTPSGIVLETNAPPPVEITLTTSTVRENTWLLSFVNYQNELPNVPVHDLKATIRLHGGFVPTICRSVGRGCDMPFTVDNGSFTIALPPLEVIEMIEIT